MKLRLPHLALFVVAFIAFAAFTLLGRKAQPMAQREIHPATAPVETQGVSAATFADTHIADEPAASAPTPDNCCPGAAAPAGGGITEPPRLEKPESLQALDDFKHWAGRFAAASQEERMALVAEGTQRAEARRKTISGLIKHDPKAAVDALLPYALRKDLPPEIARKIEHPVRGRGPLNVLGVLPLPGETVEEPIFRTATVKEKEYRVYTYGKRLAQITTPNTRLLGVGVELQDGQRVMALREEPYEVLQRDEAEDLKKQAAVTDAVCPISGGKTEASGDETAVDTGGQLIWLCSHGHVGQWLQTPDGLQIMMDVGGSGSSGGTSPVVPATHTQGNKKFLGLRVRFANQAANYEPAGDSTMQSVMQRISDLSARWSYGKLHSQFAFSPVLTMPQTDLWYKTNGAENTLRNHALAAAAAYTDGTGAHPYAPANFDFPAVIFSTGQFGNYCGTASIGGNWNMIKCVDARVMLHEYGHNFGLFHAHYANPTSNQPTGPANWEEYGNPFSTMGHGWSSFTSYERKRITWLDDANMVSAAVDGTYRIYNADKSTIVAGNPYALRVRAHEGHDFDVEYRPDWAVDGTNYSSTDNGVIIMAANYGGGANLLDMTPLGGGDYTTTTLAIGRTFSDPLLGVNITPIGKGGTSPNDYMDVVVKFDGGPANSAPVAYLTASNLNPAVNGGVNFAAIASDPDGDELSYYWEMDDGATRLGTPASKSWAGAGKYNVRCTISDRRGKSVVRSIVITVGTPTNFAISGKVTKPDGSGLADVLLRVSDTRFVRTDSDGRYCIGRLSAGAQTVTAFGYPWTLSAQFTNPVTVGPDAINCNFAATNAPAYGGVTG